MNQKSNWEEESRLKGISLSGSQVDYIKSLIKQERTEVIKELLENMPTDLAGK